MLVTTIGKFEVHLPTSGGKAGKGRQVTSSLQVRRGGAIVAQFRFRVSDPDSRKGAVAKARAFIEKTK
jgi:hypothetical protein